MKIENIKVGMKVKVKKSYVCDHEKVCEEDYLAGTVQVVLRIDRCCEEGLEVLISASRNHNSAIRKDGCYWISSAYLKKVKEGE